MRRSLRFRLVLGVIALATVGLVVADVVTYRSLSAFEISRTDGSLDVAHTAVEGPLLGGGPGGPGGGPPGPGGGDGRIARLAQAARGDFVALLRLDGTVITHRFTPQFAGATLPPPPRLPSSFTFPPVANGPEQVRYLTVSALTGGGRYRLRASIDQGAPGTILVIAVPLGAVDGTLRHLLLIELLATGGALLGIAGLGLWVVRLGLRPLDAIEETAAAIVAGNLSRRVEQVDPGTEVGRLGVALNAMLSHIEATMRDRDASLEALEASERKLRRFVADASHELRTPLSGVRAYAELFQRGASTRPSDLERSMAGISRESERMSVLIEDLLLLAHLDEGRPHRDDPIDLAEIVAEALDTARAIEPDRPLRAELSPGVVRGDRDQLRQVVDNLLANVRAHTPVTAALTVTLTAADGAAHLTVSDAGPGLAPEQRAHIFERFYRVDPSRARTSGGAGLGLAIVAAVVASHGGEVSVESTPGEGATFLVTLPLDVSVDQPPPAPL